MSSDIDIEEHDVMDHPSIKKLLPDLSWLKTELLDMDFEGISEQVQENIPIMLDDVRTVKVENETTGQNVDTPIIIDDGDEDVIETEGLIHEVPDSDSSDCYMLHIEDKQTSLLAKNTIVLGSGIPNKFTIGSIEPQSISSSEVNCNSDEKRDSEPISERDPFSAVVLLKDWGYILKNHQCYCEECSVLFPSRVAFLAHTSSEHSLLVPIEEVEAASLDLSNNCTDYLGQEVEKCPICGCVFKMHRNFLAHTESKHATDQLQPICEVFKGICMLCGRRSKSSKAFYHHVRSFHTDSYHKKYSETAPIRSTARKSTAKVDCQVIPAERAQIARKSTAKANNRSNTARKSTAKQNETSKNIALKSTAKPTQPRRVAVKSTSKNEESKSKLNCPAQSHEIIEEPESVYLTCLICGICYQRMSDYVAHCNTNHRAIYLSPERRVFTGSCECGFKASQLSVFNDHISKNHQVLFKKIATDLQEYYCHECDVLFETLASYNIHNIKHTSRFKAGSKQNGKCRKTEDLSLNTPSFKESQQSELASVGDAFIVPVETIFKCPLCHLHSLSSRSLFFHLLRCTSTSTAKLDVVCDVCDRHLRIQDTESHKLQHQIMPRIRTVEMTREAYYDLVLVCAECKIAFDCFTLQANHASQCPKKEGTLCPKCNIKIAPESAARHAKIHANNNDPVIVEFLCGNYNQLNRFCSVEQNLYYCHVCKSYDPAKQADHHRTGVCLQNNDGFRICRFCGLRFSEEGLAMHILEHENESFSLGNIKFIDIHTDSVMKPEIPELNTLCDSRVETPREKRKLKKSPEKTVYCEKCQESYYELAYKVHLQYHDYAESNDMDAEIMQRYLTMQSLWNIVYLCQSCSITFDSYDLAVEHGQDHLLKSPKPLGIRCSKCDLTVEKQSFERHKNLHKGAEIDRGSFCVLAFNFENLLSNSWEDLFEPISDEQKSHILSKSVYDVIRNIRLELKCDGSSTHTLYKCAICDAIVDKSNLLDHAFNKDECKARDPFGCSMCGLTFTSHKSLNEHKANHLAANEARILLFNKPEHFSTNMGLILQSNKIKNTTSSICIFYKCVDCGAGIQCIWNLTRHNCVKSRTYAACARCKLSYRLGSMHQHLLLHERLDKYYVAPFRKGHLVWQSRTKLVIMYECNKCKLCTMSLKRPHICSPPSTYTACNPCGLYFSKAYKFHMSLHESMPNFTRNNLLIIKYSPGLTSLDTELHAANRSPNANRQTENYNRQDIITNSLGKANFKEHNQLTEKDAKQKHRNLLKSRKSVKRTFNRGSLQSAKDAIKTLHKCGKCNLCFMSAKSVRRHLQSQHSKTTKPLIRVQVKYPCSKCGLEFFAKSLKHHVHVHHELLNLRVQDYHIRVYSASDRFTMTKMEPNKKQIPQRKLKAIVEHAKKTKLAPKASCSQTEVPICLPRSNNRRPTVSKVLQGAPQLFQCAECNVCFTNDELCYDHTLNHTPLDSTEYIACNLCEFNLLCECLGTHRKGHREGTFDIDELIVKVFRPTDGAPSVETCSARDLLQTNAISTTTN